MSGHVSGTRCPFTTAVGGDPAQCDKEAGHFGPHSVRLPGRIDSIETTVVMGGTNNPTPEMRAQAAMLGAHDGPALMVRPSVPAGPSDTTIANLARAHTASIMEWNRAHATTEPSHEDAMAIFERRDRTLFALLDALHPGWREVYDAAWGEEGRARRTAARAATEGEVSP